MNIFQDLHDSEINFAVSAFYDNGFEVTLEGEMASFREWSHAETWLAEKAIERFPDSVFAMIYRDGLSKAEAQWISRAGAESLASLKERLTKGSR